MSELSGSRAAAAKAVKHWIRRGLMRGMKGSGQPLSAPNFAAAEGLPLSRVSYHARVLSALGVTEGAGQVAHRGGAVQTYTLGGPNCETALRFLAAAGED